MTRTIVLTFAAMALVALLAGCGQQEETSATAEMSPDVQTAEVQIVSARIVDPVCGMEVDAKTAVTAEHGDKTYHFCSAQCRDQFLQDPAKHMSPQKGIDPVCGMKIEPETSFKAEYEGKTYHFCSAECHEKFLANPKQYAYCKDHDRLHKDQVGHDPKCMHHGGGDMHEGHGN